METVLLFIFGVVIFIIGLVISVALHELGHLTFAKIFGVRVSQYMVGFGKTIWSVKRGETEYGIKPVLLGGYISMAGMFPPAKVTKEDEPRESVRNNLFRALVQDARDASAETIGGADHSRAFYRASPWKRIIIMFAGPFMNLVIGFVIMLVLVTAFGSPTGSVAAVGSCVLSSPTGSGKCTSTDPESPARLAGLQAGDLFVRLDGTSYPSPAVAQSIIQRSAGKPLAVEVKRHGVLRSFTVVPARASRDQLDASGQPVTDAAGKPVVATVGVLGISLGQVLVPQPATAAFPAVGAQVQSVVSLLGRLPSGIVGVWNSVFGGAPRSATSPVGPVGVGRAIGEIASTQSAPVLLRSYDILSLLGSLNIALFVFNLLPLLPLDGGHIIGALWEMIRRFFARFFGRRDPGPVDMARLMPLTFAVVTVLVAVSALLVVADLIKPVTIG